MVFAVHKHESATGAYVSPHPEPSFHLPLHSIALGMKILCSVKKFWFKMPHITWFHLYEMSKIGKFTGKEIGLVVAKDGGKEKIMTILG